MRRLVPVLIVATVLALIAAMGADHPAAPVPAAATVKPARAQVEQAHKRAQACRAILGATAHPTRYHWRTTRSSAYLAWMLQLWDGRRLECQAAVDEAKHTDLMVAMRVVFPPWSWGRWRIILRCETGGTFSNSVVGAAGETSGFQIHPPSHPWYDAQRGHRDAYYGALSAKRVLHSQGWGAWTCARLNGLA